MANEPAPTRADLDEIRRALTSLERRLSALEGARVEQERGRESFSASPSEFERPEDAETDARRGVRTGTVLALAGRAFLAFGGAFVLRALTESGVVGPTAGVWLGLTYAIAWTVAAERSSGASRLLNGWLALAIGLPLVLESAGRFQLLSVGSSVTALTLVSGLTLALSWRRRLLSLALGATAGGALVALTLGLATGALLPLAGFTVVLAVTALWVTYDRGWTWLGWISAGAADLTVLLAALRACVRPPIESPFGTEVILAVFGAVYLGSFVLRTLLHERTVRAFEVIQTCAVMVIGFGGAILVARVNGLGLAAVGLPAAIAGVALYAQTFLRVATRRGYGGDFHYYGFTAFGLMLAAATILLPAAVLPYVTAAGALVLTTLAARLRQTPFLLQAAIALIVAATESGVFTLLASTWVARLEAWPRLAPAVIAVLTAAAACYVPPAIARLGRDGLSGPARVLTAGCLVAGLAGLVLLATGPFVAGRPPSPGVLATLRTVVLTASAVLLARLGAAPARRELAWLAYAALGVGAIKILLEDVPRSQASTLFIALAAYGLALIVTPRMTRSPGPATPASSSRSPGG